MVTATLAGDTTLATDTAVAVAVAGDTAAAADFAAVTPFTVTIDATHSTGTATFAFAPTDDAADEPAETVTVSGAATGFTVAPAQLAIADDDPPTVVRVAGTDGEYIAGDTVPIEVTFSSAVDVSGAPRLLLETGTTDRHAAYAAGTGTATLRFDYTVQARDASRDLQYVETDVAVAERRPTLKAVADGLDAVLTLPALDQPPGRWRRRARWWWTRTSRAPSRSPRRAATRATPVAFIRDAGARRPAARGERGVHGGDADGRHGDGGRGLHAGGGDARVRGGTDTTMTVTVTTHQDPIAEGDETFTATLSAALRGDGGVGEPTLRPRGTIADDDTAASDIALTLDLASVAEGAGATTVMVTATLAGTITLERPTPRWRSPSPATPPPRRTSRR